jgi:hypothetical protein
VKVRMIHLQTYCTVFFFFLAPRSRSCRWELMHPALELLAIFNKQRSTYRRLPRELLVRALIRWTRSSPNFTAPEQERDKEIMSSDLSSLCVPCGIDFPDGQISRVCLQASQRTFHHLAWTHGRSGSFCLVESTVEKGLESRSQQPITRSRMNWRALDALIE